METPSVHSSSNLRARFGLQSKSARQLLGSGSDKASRIGDSPLQHIHRGVNSKGALQGEAPSVGHDEVAQPLAAQATSPPPHITETGRELASNTETINAVPALQSTGADVSERSHNPASPSGGFNDSLGSRHYIQPAIFRAWRMQTGNIKARHSTGLTVEKKQRKTSATKSIHRRSLPAHSSTALEDKSQANEPPSSPGASVRSNQVSLPCHGCNDKGAYAMKQAMIGCATCWRRFHKRCEPKLLQSETELRTTRDLTTTLGEPGWICKVCLQKDRRPKISSGLREGVDHIKGNMATSPTKPVTDINLARLRATPQRSETPQLDVIPTIEPWEQPPTKKAKLHHMSNDGLQTIAPVSNPIDEPIDQVADTTTNLAAKDDKVNAKMLPPSAHKQTPSKNRHKQASEERLVNRLGSDIGDLSTVNCLPSLQTPINAPRLRLRTESVLRGAIGDTLLDTYARASESGSRDIAKELDQHELQELLPGLDTDMENALVDNGVSSSDKTSQPVALMPSPDSLASMNGATVPSELNIRETTPTDQANSKDQSPSARDHSLREISSSKAAEWASPPIHVQGLAAPADKIPKTKTVATVLQGQQVQRPSGDKSQHRPRPVSTGQLVKCNKCDQFILKTQLSSETICAECLTHTAAGKLRPVKKSVLAESVHLQKNLKASTPVVQRDPEWQVAASESPVDHHDKSGLAELEKDLGSSDNHSEEQIIELITLALYDAPDYSMLCRDITDWIAHNIATYEAGSVSWIGRIAANLHAHGIPGPSDSRRLWSRSKNNVGDVCTWTLCHPSKVKYRWDAALGKRVSITVQPMETPVAPSANSEKSGVEQNHISATSQPAERQVTPSANAQKEKRDIDENHISTTSQPATSSINAQKETSDIGGNHIKIAAVDIFAEPVAPSMLTPQTFAEVFALASTASEDQQSEESARIKEVVPLARGPAEDLSPIRSPLPGAEPSSIARIAPAYQAPTAVMYPCPPGTIEDMTDEPMLAPVEEDLSGNTLELNGDATTTSKAIKKTEPPKAKTLSDFELRVIERCMSHHTFDISNAQSSQLTDQDKPAKLEEIERRTTRKQMFGEPAFRSRLSQSDSFELGLRLGEEPKMRDERKRRRATAEPSVYVHDPLKGVDLGSQTSEDEPVVKYRDCDSAEDFFGAPRDMIMTISGGLAWRDKPTSSGRVRTRAKVLYRIGKSTIEERNEDQKSRF